MRVWQQCGNVNDYRMHATVFSGAPHPKKTAICADGADWIDSEGPCKGTVGVAGACSLVSWPLVLC